ncbi:MAG: hypothetical protein QF437_05820 [Planctomycetota bacterium]|jgi:hypothetical protein|nr:hypothetical protein [Planctomycetota bacterium]
MISIRRTQGVSIPRSGHAITFQLGRRYFGDKFVYCDPDGTNFCSCRTVPCVNPETTFGKNHDFALRKSTGVILRKDVDYLIQYRNPVHSITSNFQLYLKRHPEALSEEGWKKFAYRDIYYWNHFIDKWVLDYPDNAIPPFYLTYEELVGSPIDKAREIIAFMSDGDVDDEQFDKVMSKFKIEARGALSSFQYVDHGFFDEIERRTSQRLAELNLPSWRDT